MTSPVLFISGPSTGSVPGKRANGKDRFLDRDIVEAAADLAEAASGSPAMTRAAILATGRPIALATKGTVRLARGLTSIR